MKTLLQARAGNEEGQLYSMEDDVRKGRCKGKNESLGQRDRAEGTEKSARKPKLKKKWGSISNRVDFLQPNKSSLVSDVPNIIPRFIKTVPTS